jgi:hypothetical protein
MEIHTQALLELQQRIAHIEARHAALHSALLALATHSAASEEVGFELQRMLDVLGSARDRSEAANFEAHYLRKLLNELLAQGGGGAGAT